MSIRGMTLVELVMVLVLGSVLVLAMTIQFTSDLRFRQSVHSRNVTSQEAAIAVNHMTRVLRFALPDTATINADPGYSTSLKIQIQGGHISDIPADTYIEYAFNSASGSLDYIFNAGSADAVNTTIATDVSIFLPSAPLQASPGADIPIRIAITKSSRTIDVSTRVHSMAS